MMRKRLKNEQGVAMLMVLLVVIVLMGSVGFFLTHISNASTQVNTTEKVVGARLASDAGIDYYSAMVRETIFAQNNQKETIAAVTFPVLTELSMPLDADNAFQIKNVTTTLNGNVRTITFTSIGTSHGKTYEQTKTMTVTGS